MLRLECELIDGMCLATDKPDICVTINESNFTVRDTVSIDAGHKGIIKDVRFNEYKVYFYNKYGLYWISKDKVKLLGAKI